MADSSVRFDLDPLEAKDAATWQEFQTVVSKIDTAVADYLHKTGRAPAGKVHSGTAPDYAKGAVIMGVYQLAGQSAPASVSDPVLSTKGQALYKEIVAETLPQYTGRGAYTGFVDNWNTEGEDLDPVGPRSTARFLIPEPTGEQSGDYVLEGLDRRWLPPASCALWKQRLRRETTDSYVPWGIIGGDSAEAPANTTMSNVTGATNLADQITGEMQQTYKMVFVGDDPTSGDLVGYTHGMIQAIYKAYSLGPSCVPYEIAVGSQTKKMASCVPCTLFMVAQGYPPTSTHLGRGESWAPLYEPYNPNGKEDDHEWAVIRDMNNSWCEKCGKYLRLGAEVLSTAIVSTDHLAALDALDGFLQASAADKAAAAMIILDALTIHDWEQARVGRTLA